jgi:hypothetical protein
VDLPELVERAVELSARLAAADVDPDLARARLADRCRDAGVDPAEPRRFASLQEALDVEGRRRLALAIDLLDVPPLRDAAPLLLGVLDGDAGPALFRLTHATAALTVAVVREGPLRAQEFCRHLLAHLGGLVAGETEAESKQRLERLDYARLLAEAERAKMSAEERMAYIRRLQEQRAPPRRGKW